ncbi:MAG: 4Fe-4S binding protein [Acidobacteriota bacterium]|nr:4Fe-4S binding protein [Acidobacteriota bacterium]
MQKKRSKKYRIIQALRIVSQSFFFILFFYLLINTRFPGEDYIRHVEIFFHFDPLLAITTFLASRAFLGTFLFALITVAVTIILGRVACGWICPLGALHQFFSFVFKKSKLLNPKTPQDNHTVWKYYLLLFIVAGSVFTLNLAGLFDPFSLLFRSFTASIIPGLSYVFSNFLGLLYKLNLSSLGDSLVQLVENMDINAIFSQSFVIGMIFIGIVLLNIKKERFWCRYICPLGALLGLFSKWNLIKLKIDSKKCIQCGLCTIHCQTQANPYPKEKWQVSECVYCYTCSAICPTSAIQFHLKTVPEQTAPINLSRRRLIFTSILGALAVPFFRISPSTARASEKLIRPPGALPEKDFLQKCVKCGECLKVCPTNALQPALTEAGPEGIWTPILVPRIGYCEYYCSLCSQVCPTGAIKELTIEQKTEVKIGTSWINKDRCIPWKFGDPCIVCEEHCPVSPKAIKLEKIEVKLPDGTIKTPLAPFIDTELCIGCGICENKCPVVDAPAVYVTSIGESRSERNQMLLDIIKSEEDI